MAKTDNPVLGNIACTACDARANIKRRKNGKGLLYVHCPNCGMDQRSGAKLQAQLKAAVDGSPMYDVKTETPAEKSEHSDEWQPKTTQAVSELAETGEQASNLTETPSEPEQKDGFPWGKFALVGLALFGGAIGLKTKFS